MGVTSPVKRPVTGSIWPTLICTEALSVDSSSLLVHVLNGHNNSNVTKTPVQHRLA